MRRLTLDPSVQQQDLALPDPQEDARTCAAHVRVVRARAHHLPRALGELRLAAVALWGGRGRTNSVPTRNS